MKHKEQGRPHGVGARFALLLVVALGLAWGAAPALAQQNGEQPLVEEGFSIRVDEDLYQLEEAVSLIAASLSRVSDQVQTLAINSFYFGSSVSTDFRRKAEVVILDQLFKANPNVRLVECAECQKLETRIQRGILRLRKGIPTREARRELAQKLGVDGFVDIGMFQDNGQLTVYLKVVEAESGAIILVDELAGRRAPERDSLTFTFGETNFPIDIAGSTTQHRALVLGVKEAVQLTERFSFSVDLTYFIDNNDNNPDPHLTLDGGLMLTPALGFDIVRLPASTSRLIWHVGLGKLIAPQLDYANYLMTGLEFVVGDNLTIAFSLVNYLEANVEVTNSDISDTPELANGATLQGVGNELRFGYRF